jgi:hypothetical protein
MCATNQPGEAYGSIVVNTSQAIFFACIVCFLLSTSALFAGSATNQPPVVVITYPFDLTGLPFLSDVPIKVNAEDKDGSVIKVEFFAEILCAFDYFSGNHSNALMLSLGLVTNAPYKFTWTNASFQRGSCADVALLTAKATDDGGAQTISKPVAIGNAQAYTNPEIVSPRGGVYSAPATFDLVAHAWGNNGQEDPVEFYAGTNLVDSYAGTNLLGVVPEPPYILTVTNLPEGQYWIYMKFHPPSRGFDVSGPIFITVARLELTQAGIQPPGFFQFLVTGTVPRYLNLIYANVIEASTDLTNWLPISTNFALTNSYLFLDGEATNFSRRFYRVLLNP